ncbi:MAG: hypothetical protein J1D85_06060 [Bacteroidales bacterium]|nr:hypothetical protein [Bacteroidales bacterium]
MNATYLLIIGAIAAAYLIFMYGIRRRLVKRTSEPVSDLSADEAMKRYLEKTVPELDVKEYRLLWGATFGNTDIIRIFAYNEERILVIPAKVEDGDIVMPAGQPSAHIELDTVDHIHIGRKESLMRMMFVTLFFDAKDEENNFDIWREKTDACGNDNRPNFVEFIDFIEDWARRHNIPTETL